VIVSKCEDYIEQYIEAGDDYAAKTFDCSNKFRFQADDFRLWSASVYYTIVTLTTCARLPCIPVPVPRLHYCKAGTQAVSDVAVERNCAGLDLVLHVRYVPSASQCTPVLRATVSLRLICCLARVQGWLRRHHGVVTGRDLAQHGHPGVLSPCTVHAFSVQLWLWLAEWPRPAHGEHMACLQRSLRGSKRVMWRWELISTSERMRAGDRPCALRDHSLEHSGDHPGDVAQGAQGQDAAREAHSRAALDDGARAEPQDAEQHPTVRPQECDALVVCADVGRAVAGGG
jgi:hypothetical protein